MAAKPEPLIITRVLSAPRALVFEAFSTAEHMKAWFSPIGYTVPAAEIDFRPGGVCNVCMRSPEGKDFWSKGRYVEITPPTRLVFTSGVAVGDEQKFTAYTTITLEEEGAGTRLTVHQAYDIHDEAFLSSVEGAPQGWRTTLDKLERLTEQMATPAVHDSFTVERTLDAAPAQVFAAFATEGGKGKWFHGPPGWTTAVEAFDVRPGGRERAVTRSTEGLAHIFDAAYFEVTPRRIVYAYEMHLNERRISVSLATVEITPKGSGTTLKITEQGAFLNGYDDAGSREQGTNQLMDQLAASLIG